MDARADCPPHRCHGRRRHSDGADARGEQEEQERAARIEEGVQELVKLARERDPTLTEQEALREVSIEIQPLREARLLHGVHHFARSWKESPAVEDEDVGGAMNQVVAAHAIPRQIGDHAAPVVDHGDDLLTGRCGHRNLDLVGRNRNTVGKRGLRFGQGRVAR